MTVVPFLVVGLWFLTLVGVAMVLNSLHRVQVKLDYIKDYLSEMRADDIQDQQSC